MLLKMSLIWTTYGNMDNNESRPHFYFGTQEMYEAKTYFYQNNLFLNAKSVF